MVKAWICSLCPGPNIRTPTPSLTGGSSTTPPGSASARTGSATGRAPRAALESYSWEIPEGGGDASESPFEAMRRELAEETGLSAQIWEPLGFFHPSNSSTDEEAFLFLATGLAPVEGHQTEDDEELLLHREPFPDCLRRVLSGEITDGLTIVALLALQARRSGV